MVPYLGSTRGAPEQMTEQARQLFPSEGTIEIEHQGRRISGNFSIGGGRITVTTVLGSKTALITSAQSARTWAGLLLRELAKEGKV